VKRLFLSVSAVFFVAGCAPRLPHPSADKEQRLVRMLVAMDGSVDRAEARRLAHEAIAYSRTLAGRYHVTTSPWVHNFLVNVHLRDRGLCYQWADDLYTHLDALHLKTLTLSPVGANIGRYFTEHNALAVLPSRHALPLGKGILLDPWRHSGDLFFVHIGKDAAYRWQIRPERIPHIGR
jgi:hypothetical protein